MALKLYASLNGVALGDGGPITSVVSAQIVMTSLSQFPAHQVTLAASDERTILAMAPFTLIEIQQEPLLDNGTSPIIGYGYILDPSHQITDRDESTITVDLAPLTTELTWYRTGPGWIFQNNLQTFAARMGALVPGWTFTYVDAAKTDAAGNSLNITINVNLNNPSVLDGFLSTAKQFSQFVRQGVDANGVPTRTLEMGLFGAAATVTVQDAKGGDPQAITEQNGNVRLIGSVERHPNNVSDLRNVAIPYGGGQDIDSAVNLERLWRIINDVNYPGAGLYGNVPGSLFPEYDPAYPISDPRNPPTGSVRWQFEDAAGNPVTGTYTASYGARGADGVYPIIVRDGTGAIRSDVFGILSQGAATTRGFALDGHSLYYVYDAASYGLYGHKERDYTDSTVTYTSNNKADQEYTERALYASMVAYFKRYAHPHHTFTCTVPGLARVTPAGDYVNVDYQRVSVNDTGAVVEMDVVDTLRVTSIVRSFNGDDPPMDTHTLSNLGRFDDDDNTVVAETQAAVVAVQRQQGTGIGTIPIWGEGNVDARHPMVRHVRPPKRLYRWANCTLRVNCYPYRATSTTGQNTPATITITGIDHGTHSLSGTFPTQDQTIPAVENHFHRINVGANTGAAPNLRAPGNAPWTLLANTEGKSGDIYTNQGEHYATSHNHSVPVSNAPVTPQHTSLSGPMPNHTHPLDRQIQDASEPLPPYEIAINNVLLTSGLRLIEGARNADGSFQGTMELDDVSAVLEKITGNITIEVRPRTIAGSNPYGVMYVTVEGMWESELGGLPNTIRPA
jgi:hypothetical protein